MAKLSQSLLRRLGLGVGGIILMLMVCGAGWYWFVARLQPDPERVRVETEDLEHFLAALDSLPRAMTAADSVRILQHRYLDRGSPGLDAFLDSRIGGVEELQRQIATHSRYYKYLKTSLADPGALERGIRDGLRALKQRYPAAAFADVYLVIGRMGTGGTTVPGKVLIGAEMYARDERAPIDELSDWERTVLASIELLPTIVIHETIHLMQPVRLKHDLLEQSLREGGADFVASVITGHNINAHLQAWASGREATLWKEFLPQMESTSYESWFYRPRDGRPADLGYYVGYRIAESYYERSADKRQAIHDIIRIGDARRFLEASGYDP